MARATTSRSRNNYSIFVNKTASRASLATNMNFLPQMAPSQSGITLSKQYMIQLAPDNTNLPRSKLAQQKTHTAYGLVVLLPPENIQQANGKNQVVGAPGHAKQSPKRSGVGFEPETLTLTAPRARWMISARWQQGNAQCHVL